MTLTASERRFARALVDQAARARAAERKAVARGALRVVPEPSDEPATGWLRDADLADERELARIRHGRVLRSVQVETVDEARERVVTEAYTKYPAVMARFLAVMPVESTVDRELHAARAAQVTVQALVNARVPWPLRAAGALGHTIAGQSARKEGC